MLYSIFLGRKKAKVMLNGKQVMFAGSASYADDEPEQPKEQLLAPTTSLSGDTLTITNTDDRTEEFVILVDGVEMTTVEVN